MLEVKVRGPGSCVSHRVCAGGTSARGPRVGSQGCRSCFGFRSPDERASRGPPCGCRQEVLDADRRVLGVVDLPLGSEELQEPAAAVPGPPWRVARPAHATVVVLRRGCEGHASAGPTRAVVAVGCVGYAGRAEEGTPVNLGRQPPPVGVHPGRAGGGRCFGTGGVSDGRGPRGVIVAHGATRGVIGDETSGQR